jgi:signal recognition particle subunit SRP54
MFENLSDKLQRSFKTLRGQGTITDENIGEALREIRLALIEADVSLSVVTEVVDHIPPTPHSKANSHWHLP